MYIKSFDRAYQLWRQKRLPEAMEVLESLETSWGAKTLQTELLRAYVFRDQRKYLSETEALQRLLQDFADTGEKKLLADGWSLLGEALRMLGESRLAVQAFCKAAKLEPDNRQSLTEYSNAIFTANAIDDIKAEEMQRLYAKYREQLSLIEVKPYLPMNWQHKKIRVGYMSADLRNHPVAHFVRPLLTQYDHERFRVFVYSLGMASDDITKELQAGGAVWHSCAGAAWSQIAAQIRMDEIDILVDLSGHTAETSLPVFAWKPASIQIFGIGYFNSTGMPETTGFLSDRYCAPEQRSAYFVEPLLRLPYSHFCYQPFYCFPEAAEAPCKRNGYMTFGCFNNFAKVTDTMLRAWREILLTVPDSQLVLKQMIFNSEGGKTYSLQRMKKAGLPVERVECRGFSPNYLEEYNDIDIALDTSPYNGGLTTCEALYMGVPVVSLIGNYHGARFGYSFLQNIGLPELAAKDVHEYISIAAALSKEPALLQQLRMQLRERIKVSPLMNARQYVDEVEELFVSMLFETGN